MINCDVAIIGGGPVGLFLACRLAQLGINFCLLEKNAQRIIHSRSIGIHPPSLQCLNQLGVVDAFLEQGHKIETGVAYANRQPLGEINFATLSKPFNFILTLPQHQTEAILEDHLKNLRSKSILRGWRATALKLPEKTEGALHVNCLDGLGDPQMIHARYVVGCDGKQSVVRKAMRVEFLGGDYPDTYLMGDFADNPPQGPNAAIYLADEGLVESFPLPNGLRRWVVKTDRFMDPASVDALCDILEARVGILLNRRSNSMLSAFGVQHYLAARFVQGRLILAGDAAHILSPIGGQGMNLGWLDAWALSNALRRILMENKQESVELTRYASQRKASAQIAIRRAEFNMAMGRKSRWAPLRQAIMKILLNSPLKNNLAGRFTMHGLR